MSSAKSIVWQRGNALAMNRYLAFAKQAVHVGFAWVYDVIGSCAFVYLFIEYAERLFVTSAGLFYIIPPIVINLADVFFTIYLISMSRKDGAQLKGIFYATIIFFITLASFCTLVISNYYYPWLPYTNKAYFYNEIVIYFLSCTVGITILKVLQIIVVKKLDSEQKENVYEDTKTTPIMLEEL